MNLLDDFNKLSTRRAFLARSSTGLGAIALSSLLNQKMFGAEAKPRQQVCCLGGCGPALSEL